MVTTLIPTPTTLRFVSSRSAARSSHATVAGTRSSDRLETGAATFAVTVTTPAVSVVAPFAAASATVAPTANRWLDGAGALGCGNHEGMYGTKRIHPGRLGGVT